MGFVARLCQPSTLRMLIWPQASSAQNNMAAVSADRMDEACLQSALLNEPRADRRNVRLAIAKRVRRCMHRVVPEDEIVLMRSRRAENELDIGQRFEFDRFARRLESREVSVPQLVRHREDARCDSDPEDGVARSASAGRPSGVSRGN
jgi:hypothetical protein